jgi:hypothetical protein
MGLVSTLFPIYFPFAAFYFKVCLDYFTQFLQTIIIKTLKHISNNKIFKREVWPATMQILVWRSTIGKLTNSEEHFNTQPKKRRLRLRWRDQHSLQEDATDQAWSYPWRWWNFVNYNRILPIRACWCSWYWRGERDGEMSSPGFDDSQSVSDSGEVEDSSFVGSCLAFKVPEVGN